MKRHVLSTQLRLLCATLSFVPHALLLAFAAMSTSAQDGGYLFVTFKGEQTPMTEQVYFAVSKDGRRWDALNRAEPVLVSTLGEKGVRDPYLLRSHEGGKFHLLATDLSIALNGDWGRAQHAGSKSIVIWDSPDLVHWSRPRLVKVAPDDAGCTWAPEAVYDEGKKAYLTFWASRTKSDEFRKQRIWAAWTRDFVAFEAPFVYIDKPWDVIDTDIVRENGRYYRFSKDEQYKSITLEVSTNLLGNWTEAAPFSLAKIKGYEGPECYPIKVAANGTPTAWCLILDQYSKGTGYQPFVTEDLSSGQFKSGEGFVFPFRFRHGSVLPLSSAEYQRLEQAYGSTK
jgi:sucrose-6-phosphate hydrolase SacC (GH32 family)